jgi:hypothetical protein
LLFFHVVFPPIVRILHSKCYVEFLLLQTTREGTIYLEDGTYINGARPDDTTKVLLEITGGMVENTSTTTGNAVYDIFTGAVNITGGTVSKAGSDGYAVYHKGLGELTIGSRAKIVGKIYDMQ